jgi:anti-sigma factor RsiW
MICSELEPLIQAYVDGEIASSDAAELEGHLAGCPDCDARVSMERRERMALRQHLKASQTLAPDSVRNSVRASLQRERRRVMTTQLTRWGSVTLAIAAAYTVLFHTRSHVDIRLSEEAAMRHARLLPMEFREFSEANVETWFDGKLSHPVRLPRLANVTLSGGRLSHLSDHDAAYVVYDAAPRPGERVHRVGLFVLEGRPSMDPRNSDIQILAIHGYNVAIWDGGGLSYQLVTDLDESEIRRMVGGNPSSAYSVQPASLQIH